MNNQIQLFGILDFEARALNLLIVFMPFLHLQDQNGTRVLQFALYKTDVW